MKYATIDKAEWDYTRVGEPDVAAAGRYSSADDDARKLSKAAFTSFKFDWLRQVAGDASLPRAAASVAILIVDYLNEGSGDAWPALDTLAGKVGRGKTQIREALRALTKNRHLCVDITTGGKGQTNRYRPILQASKRSGNPKGSRWLQQTELGFSWGTANPPETLSQTVRKSPRKPSEKSDGTPRTDTHEDPQGGASSARPMQSSTSSQEGERAKSEVVGPQDDARSRLASVCDHGEFQRSSPSPRPSSEMGEAEPASATTVPEPLDIRVGQVVDDWEFEGYLITDIKRSHIIIQGSEGTLRVPRDREGRPNYTWAEMLDR